jgi:hypothetical protein
VLHRIPPAPRLDENVGLRTRGLPNLDANGPLPIEHLGFVVRDKVRGAVCPERGSAVGGLAMRGV